MGIAAEKEAEYRAGVEATEARKTVEVTIDGTGGGGYHRVINVPVPAAELLWKQNAEALDDWWYDNVFVETGSGKGGHDFCEVKITRAPANRPELIGLNTSWEG